MQDWNCQTKSNYKLNEKSSIAANIVQIKNSGGFDMKILHILGGGFHVNVNFINGAWRTPGP